LTLAIRTYVETDLEDMVRIYNESFHGLHSCWANPMTLEWFMNRFGGAFKAKTGTAFIAEKENQPVGYALITTQNRPQVGLVAYVSGICVVPHLQRQGIGTMLMIRAMEWAKGQAAVLVENDDEIIENPVAISFFEKLGFAIFHRGAYMSKDLMILDRFGPLLSHVIRELQVEDLDQLYRVRTESFKEFGPWYSAADAESFKSRMKNRIGQDDVKVFVATENSHVIGYVVASIRETNRTDSDIRVVAVLPEHRNKGVGTALMARSFDYLRRTKVTKVSTVTETAEVFYQKVGFKVDRSFVRVRKFL